LVKCSPLGLDAWQPWRRAVVDCPLKIGADQLFPEVFLFVGQYSDDLDYTLLAQSCSATKVLVGAARWPVSTPGSLGATGWRQADKRRGRRGVGAFFILDALHLLPLLVGEMKRPGDFRIAERAGAEHLPVDLL